MGPLAHEICPCGQHVNQLGTAWVFWKSSIRHEAGLVYVCLCFLLTINAPPTNIELTPYQPYTAKCLYGNPDDLPINKSHIKKKVDAKTMPSIRTYSRCVAACQPTAAKSPHLRLLVISRPRTHVRQRPKRKHPEPSKLRSIDSTTTRDLLREIPPEL